MRVFVDENIWLRVRTIRLCSYFSITLWDGVKLKEAKKTQKPPKN
jgi:hypothetical protein